MNALICTTFLLFGFTFGGLKFPNDKLSGLAFSVFENNILGERSRSHGFDSNELIRGLVKFMRGSNLDTHNSTNSGDRQYIRGKSKETNVVVILLVLVFKIMVLLSLPVVKFFLLKGFFGAKVALIILGVIFARKLRQFGTLVLLRNQQFYIGNGPGQYPTNEPNLSGYGYEYNFVSGFQTPEQKYLFLTGKGESKKHAKISNK